MQLFNWHWCTIAYINGSLIFAKANQSMYKIFNYS